MSNFLFLKNRLLNNIDEKGEYIIEIQLEEWTCFFFFFFFFKNFICIILI